MYEFHTFGKSIVYTCLIRNFEAKDADRDLGQNGSFVAWNILYISFIVALVIPFFKALTLAHFQHGKLEYLLSERKLQKEFVKYLYRILSRKKKSQVSL